MTPVARVMGVRSARVSLIALGLYSLFFLRPLVSHEWLDDSLGFRDWDLNFFYAEAVRKSVVEYHEIPSWNPFYNGGLPVFENPQVRLFTPAMILTLIFGTVPGIKLSILFHWILCAAGSAYLFWRVLRLRTAAVLAGSILFPFCGYLPQHLFAGHANALSVTLCPWALAFFLRWIRLKSLRYALLAAGVTAWMLWDGHPYGFLQFLLVACAFVFFESLARRSLAHYRSLALFLLFTFAFSAPRIIPEAQYMMRFGAYYRPDTQAVSLFQIWDAFTSQNQFPLQAARSPNQEYAWWEYGNYIGIIPFLILIVSAPLLRRRHWPLLAVLGVLLLLMMGKFHPLSPSSLLAHVPGFSNTRIPMRWSACFVLVLALVMSLLLERMILFLQRRVSARIVHAASMILALGLAYDLKRNHDPLRMIFRTGVHAKDLAIRGDRSIETVASLPGYGADSAQFPAVLNHLSLKNGYEALLSPRPVRAAGDPDYRGEFYLDKAGTRATPLRWSPGSIEFSLESKGNDSLIVNQTFFPGWSADRGYSVGSSDGRLSVPLRAGMNSFTICYASPGVAQGTAGGCLLLAAGLIWSLRRRIAARIRRH